MHILIAAPEGLVIPPASGGSVQIYLHSLIPALAGRDDLNVTLLSPGNERTRMHGSGLTHEVYTGHRFGTTSYEQWVLRQIARLRPDMIQIENRPRLADGVLRLRRQTTFLQTAKVILNLHSTTFLGPMHGSQKLMGQTLRDVDAVVVNSYYLKRATARRLGIGDSSFPATVIYPGVDLRRFGAQSSGGSLPRPLRLIFVGRVIQLKGVAVLIEAVSQLVCRGIPVRLTIVGRTPPWERSYGLRVHQASRTLPIEWKGFVSPRRLPKLLTNHDLLVLPSQRREAFGLVNLEAMAAGLPVIGSRVGGIPEVVTKDSGVLVDDYHSPTAFANAIAQLVQKPQLYRKLKAGATKRSKEFTWQNTASNFERLYQELSASRSDLPD